MTNAYIGLPDVREDTHGFPSNPDFDARCQRLLAFKIELFRPVCVVCLGVPAARMLASVAKGLEFWKPWPGFRAVQESHTGLASVGKAHFAAVAVHHPSAVIAPKERREERREIARVIALGEVLAPDEIRGPAEQEPENGFRRFDYSVWVYRHRWRRVTVYVDAGAWDEPSPASLPSPLRENVEALGRVALEEQLESRNYPRRIFVDRSAVRTEGVQVVFYPLLWFCRIAIGAAPGYALTRTFGGVVALNSFVGALLFGSWTS